MAVHLFCIALIVHFGSLYFLYWLLVIQHVKLWCHCFGYFHLVFGVFLILFFVVIFSLFIVLFVHCLDVLFWYYILMVLLVGHSACETLVSLFMGFSFGVWCVFDLVLLLFFVVVLFVCGCAVLVVHPFFIAYWSVSMGTFDVTVFGVFIWCLASFQSCFVGNFVVGHCSVCLFFGYIVLVVFLL